MKALHKKTYQVWMDNGVQVEFDARNDIEFLLELLKVTSLFSLKSVKKVMCLTDQRTIPVVSIRAFEPFLDKEKL